MGRTLPWLKDQGQKSKKDVPSRPVKRQRIQELDTDEDALPTPIAPSTPRHTAIKRADRTPSTSPPPPPQSPPKEEFMREGLDADDIYIMVEDEFYATAKTFTQHLHHAEYQRLKNSAKMKSASAVSNIMRPTDSITAMREETKKRKEAEAKAMKHKAALEKIRALGGSKRVRAGDSDEESDLEATRNDDPWIGTSLQSFMVNRSQDGTSLTGLDRIKSRTRAAAGYSKPDHRPTQSSKSFGLTPFKATSSKQTTVEPPRLSNDDDATTSDDDDLDTPILPRKAQPAIHYKPPASHPQRRPTHLGTTKQVNFTHKKPPSPEPTLPPSLTSKATIKHPPQSTSKRTPPSSSSTAMSSTKGILKPPKPPSGFDLYDDLPRQPVLQSEASKRRMKRMELKARSNHENSNLTATGNINEIPIFLV